jgi:flagellar biosynthesis/type III secretory pathway M-ring protein FliF/YscJ
MTDLRVGLASVLLAATMSSAYALDRLHFKGLSEDDLTPILTAFQQVNVHYLVTADGNSILSRLSKPNP